MKPARSRPHAGARRVFPIYLAAMTVAASAFAQVRGIVDTTDPAVTSRKPFQRAEWAFRQRALPGKVIPPEALERAVEQLRQAEAVARLRDAAEPLAKRVLKGEADAGEAVSASVAGVIAQWVNAGPAPINGSQNTSNVYDPSLIVSGRIPALAVDPQNPNRWIAGAAQGGIWVTANAGASWSAKTDAMPSLAIGAVAFSRNNPQTVYAGTGESVSSDAYAGVGLLKSTDSGETWQHITSSAATFLQTCFSEIRVHPDNPNLLVATTTSNLTFGRSAVGSGIPANVPPRGIFKSTDGGASWSKTFPTAPADSVEASDLEVDAGNFSNQFAGLTNSDVYRSINAGDSWQALNGPWTNATAFPGGVGRVELAISPNDPNVLFVSIAARTGANRGQLLGIWRTTNALAANVGDISWSQLPSTTTSNILWYCHQILVDPTDSRILYLGDVGFQRYDGRPGANPVWKTLTLNLHADQQAMAFAGNRLIAGNDGGVYYRDDHGDTSVNWVNCNTNLSITQYYDGAVHPTNKNVAIGGAQDNGSSRFTGTPGWNFIGFGDGAVPLISRSQPETNWLVSSQNLSLWRTTTGSTNPDNYTNAGAGITDAPGLKPFIGRVVKHPTNDNVVLAGTDKIWRSNNFFSAPSAPAWSPNSGSAGTAIQVSAITFASSDGNANTYAFGTSAGQIFMTTDAGANWRSLDTMSDVPNRWVTDLDFDPNDANTLYATLSSFDENTVGAPGHVFRTRTALGTGGPTRWQSISPASNVPHNTIAVDPTHPEVIYVGTDVGVWQGETQGDDSLLWTPVGNPKGLPNVAVFDLHVQYLTRRIFAFTHGRGAFIADLFPANDHVENARVLSGASGRVVDTNINATIESGEPDTHPPTPERGEHSVWFLWQAPIGGMVEFNTIDSNFDTDLAVYELGADWNGLDLPAKVSDNNGGGNGTSKVTFEATVGTPYFICVNGSAPNDTGFYALNWVIEDQTPPAVTVTEPPHNGARQVLTEIGGTALDPSGIQDHDVVFTLYYDGTGEFWTGSGWSSTLTALHATAGAAGRWSYTDVPTGSNLFPGRYYVSAHATDRAGNLSPAEPGVNQTTFFVDGSPPTAAINTPADGSTIDTKIYTFTGQANDDLAVQRVVLFLRRNSDFTYWNGSTWISEPLSANLSSTYNSATHNWTSSFNLPVPGATLSNGSYNFIAIAFDTAGNSVQTDSAVTVDFHEIYTWTLGSYSDTDPNNNNYYWGNPANWFPEGVPGPNDVAIIDRGDLVRSNISRTVYRFEMSNGGLDFDNAGDSLSLTKAGKWTGGTFEDVVNIHPLATFEISGTNTKAIGYYGVVNNYGSATWTGPGLLQGNQNSTWNNKAGGSFTVTTDGDCFANYSGGNVFNNEAGAQLIKSAGVPESSTYLDEWTFNNAGQIDSQAGTIHFNLALNLTPGTTFAGAGRILLQGTTNLSAAITSTGHPELIGTLNGSTPNAGFSGTHPWVWSSGVIDGSFTLAAGSVLEFTTSATKLLGYYGVFTNQGRFHWRAGLFQGYQNSTFNNESGSVFEVFSDGDIFANYSGGNVFNNKMGALFVKSASAATPTESYVDEWSFNNAGAIRSDDGLLHFNNALNLNAGGTISRLGSQSARVLSNYFVLTGTTTIENVTFEAGGNWAGNTTPGTAGDGTIATSAGGVFEWTAGTANNTVNIAPNSTFNLSGGNVKQLGYQCVLNNSGNATLSGTGPIQGYQNSTFNNLGTFTALSDADFINFSGGNRFVNAFGGIFQKTGGTEDNRFDWAFDNSGTVASTTGAVAFNNGGTSSGTFSPAGAGFVRFTGGTHDLITTATFNGSGKMQITGGTVQAVNNVSGNSALGLLEIAGGLLTSAPAGSFNIVGNVSWTAGTIGGTCNFQAGSAVQISGTNTKAIDYYGVINNYGSATWTGPGLLQGNQSSTWNNKAGSSFTVASDGDVFANYSPGNIFNNEAGAQLIKSAGVPESSTYLDEWTFNNAGQIDSQAGTIHFNLALNLTPGTTFAGAGRILLQGTTNLSAAITSTGHPELIGTLNGSTPNAGFSGTHPWVWSSGVIDGSFTLAAGSVLEFTTSATKLLGYYGVFTNQGRFHWRAGLFQGYQNSTFNNESGSVFEVFSDGDIFANYSGGNVFNNKMGALFVKSASAATPTESYVDEWSFNNAGAIRSDDGLLHFNNALNLNAGGTISRLGSQSARVLSNYFVLTGTTTIENVTFEAGGNWAGNTTPGTAGDGTIATSAGGVFEWTAGTANNTVNIAPNSTFNLSGGNVKQLGYQCVLNNSGNATLSGTGPIQGYQNSTFNNLGTFTALSDADFINFSGGNTFVNNGVLNLGGPLGITDMNWNFVQSGTGRLNIEIAGTNAATPQFDQLRITGSASLDGVVALSFLNGFGSFAQPTDVFDIVTAGSPITTPLGGNRIAVGGTYGSFAVQLANGGYALRLTDFQTGPATFENWATRYGLSGADANPNADPNRNGLPNLLEYALGFDPTAVGGPLGTTSGIIEENGQKYLGLSYTKPTGAEAPSDIIYAPERASSLASPNWSSSVVDIVPHSVVPGPGSLETVTVRSTHPISGTAREFLRLRVTLQ